MDLLTFIWYSILSKLLIELAFLIALFAFIGICYAAIHIIENNS